MRLRDPTAFACLIGLRDLAGGVFALAASEPGPLSLFGGAPGGIFALLA